MNTFGSGNGAWGGAWIGSTAQAFGQARFLREREARMREQEFRERLQRRRSEALGLELLQLLYPAKVAAIRAVVGLVPKVTDAEFDCL